MNWISQMIIKLMLCLSFMVVGATIATTLIEYNIVQYVTFMKINTVLILLCFFSILIVLKLYSKKHN